MKASLNSDELACRAAVYRLLARLWREELDAEGLKQLQQPAVRDAYIAVGGWLPTAADQQTLDALAVDFCQLFLGPRGHLPPYQSVWMEGQFQGATVQSMREYLSLLDTHQWDALPMPDHLGVELEVMAFLLQQLGRTERTAPEFNGLTQLIAAFFRDHLAWSEMLCKTAGERAQTEFYRGMIKATSAFLDGEQVLSDECSGCAENPPFQDGDDAPEGSRPAATEF